MLIAKHLTLLIPLIVSGSDNSIEIIELDFTQNLITPITFTKNQEEADTTNESPNLGKFVSSSFGKFFKTGRRRVNFDSNPTTSGFKASELLTM
jgi:hypothetical protein